MKSSNSRGELAFLAVVALTFLSSSGLLARDLFFGGKAAGGEKVGLITYRNREAEQKSSGSALWSAAPQKGPVYNRDTIRTGSDSSAVIQLENGVEIDLAADSMVVVSLDRAGGAKLELAKGGAVLDSRKGQGKITLASGGHEIKVAGGKLSLTKSGADTSLSLLEGTAERVDGGKAEAIASDRTYGVSAGTEKLQTLVSPQTGSVIMTGKPTAPVSFSWKSPTRARTVEIAADSSFSSILARIPVQGETAAAELPEGSWYWRLSGEGSFSWFTVRELEAPRPLSPAGERFTWLGKPVPVSFSWLGGDTEVYRLTIAPASRPGQPIFSEIVSRQSIVVPIAQTGDYTWTVTSLSGKEAIPAESEPSQFSIDRGQLSVPRIIGDPRRGASVALTAAASGAPLVSWTPVPNADRYEAIVTPVGGQSFPPVTVTINYLSMKIEAGRYSVAVRALSDSGASSALCDPVPLAVTAAPPTAPSPGMAQEAKSTALPAQPAEAPTAAAKAAGPRLASPRPLSPVGGERLDINRISSIKLTWEASPGAASYRVRLFRTTGGLRSPVGEWTTTKTELAIDDFSNLSLDPFAWELTAVKAGADGAASLQSETAVSYFRIIQGEELGAVRIRKMTVKGGYQ